MITIDASQLTRYLKRVGKRGDKVVRRHLLDALEQSGATVAGRAKDRAPRRTGALSQSIEVSASGVEVEVSSPLAYAGFVEEGTKVMRAQPYLAPALAESNSDIERAIDAAGDRIITDLARM